MFRVFISLVCVFSLFFSAFPLLARSPEAGERRLVSVDGVEYPFRWIPAGSFLMGSDESEIDRDDDETLHNVTLSSGFWMLETEVTQGMWFQIMGSTVRQLRDEKGSDWRLRAEGENLPIYYVDWKMAKAFCEKLGTLIGETVLLPTEAQWEYACRAGRGGAISSEEREKEAWFFDNSDERVHPVGEKTPNPWGLYDMLGNLSEWCEDRYQNQFPAEPVIDPKGGEKGAFRVLRGGSWDYFSSSARYASRNKRTNDSRFTDIGFRVVILPKSENKNANGEN